MQISWPMFLIGIHTGRYEIEIANSGEPDTQCVSVLLGILLKCRTHFGKQYTPDEKYTYRQAETKTWVESARGEQRK